MTLPQVVQDAVDIGNASVGPYNNGFTTTPHWQLIVAELHRLTEIAEGVEPLVIRLGEVTEKLESLRAWNERVSVCRDHTADVVDGECLVCRLAAANALLREVFESIADAGDEYSDLGQAIKARLQGAGDEA